MDDTKLRAILDEHVAKWSRRPFSELFHESYPSIVEGGSLADGSYWCIEVSLLERNSEYVQLMIAADEGTRIRRSMNPFAKTITIRSGERAQDA